MVKPFCRDIYCPVSLVERNGDSTCFPGNKLGLDLSQLFLSLV